MQGTRIIREVGQEGGCARRTEGRRQRNDRMVGPGGRRGKTLSLTQWAAEPSGNDMKATRGGKLLWRRL